MNPLKIKAFSVCRYYTVTAHLCDHRPAKRRRCEDGIQYARPLRRRLYPAHLHPCHPTDAGPGSGEDGELYGTGDVGRKQKEIPGDLSLGISNRFRLFPLVGQGVGPILETIQKTTP